MRILHTSDWHLGRRLLEQPLQYEQEKFLEWIIGVIIEQKIDILLVSGDIFDTGYPSSQSLDLFYRFLSKVYRHTQCKEVIMTAGNHDAPGTINAPDNFMRNFNINLIGRASENVEDEIFSFDMDDERLMVAAVPFLRDRDIRHAIAGEDALEIENRYKKALTNHYHKIAEVIETKNPENAFVIAMGHLFAIGAQASDSESRIYVGGLGDISASDFPDVFDYVALGHLHRPQQVGGKANIRYSGSPYPLSFSEAGQSKKVILISTSQSQLSSIEEIEVPAFREFISLRGTMEQCINKLQDVAKHTHSALPFVEVMIEGQGILKTAYAEINEAAKDLPLKVLKVKIIDDTQRKGLEQLIDDDKQLNELQADDIFKKKCEEENFDLQAEPEIMDAFYEILNNITD